MLQRLSQGVSPSRPSRFFAENVGQGQAWILSRPHIAVPRLQYLLQFVVAGSLVRQAIEQQSRPMLTFFWRQRKRFFGEIDARECHEFSLANLAMAASSDPAPWRGCLDSMRSTVSGYRGSSGYGLRCVTRAGQA